MHENPNKPTEEHEKSFWFAHSHGYYDGPYGSSSTLLRFKKKQIFQIPAEILGFGRGRKMNKSVKKKQTPSNIISTKVKFKFS